MKKGLLGGTKKKSAELTKKSLLGGESNLAHSRPCFKHDSYLSDIRQLSMLNVENGTYILHQLVTYGERIVVR
jgi:hypothetical protein